MSEYFCCEDQRRRNEVAALPDVNGIDFLEVLDIPGEPDAERQRTLLVHFIHDPTSLGVVADNVAVSGGERITGLHILETQLVPVDGSPAPVLSVTVDRAGDYSLYTLQLSPTVANPLSGLDLILRNVAFSFKVGCETQFDPQQSALCPPSAPSEPALDYLARDFTSLRQLMLDRLALLSPRWQERNPADIGIALVELLAYVGDLLSYRQDAIATEAYLDTCRLRTSARRHARLVDYTMHDGCNARAWIQLTLAGGTAPFELSDATFYSLVPGLPAAFRPGRTEQAQADDAAATAFTLLAPALMTPAHNQIRFYTWGARECCLPIGAVGATLRGPLPDLAPGMVLVLQEVRSPRTGAAADADLTHRHAVRLTSVTRSTDPLGGRFDDPPTGDSVEVCAIVWDPGDALPFPLCISAETDAEFGAGYVEDVSVALGNVVLADHGSTVIEDVGLMPQDSVRQVLDQPPNDDAVGPSCRPDLIVLAPARFSPRLRSGPLTQAVPYDPSSPPASAAGALAVDPRSALPAITLDDGVSTEPWSARPDLLASRTIDQHFVVEVEADGLGRIRFGDGSFGARPVAGRRFTATYRVNNGTGGNMGAGTFVHVATTAAQSIEGVTNPLPAVGGTEMETIDEVRHRAPVAFRPQTQPGRPDLPLGATLQRAVTPADYAALAATHPAVQRAAATPRWTGSWTTVSVTIDPLGTTTVTEDLEETLQAFLEPFRLAGQDVEIEPPLAVALEIAMTVNITPGYHVDPVRAALLDVLGDRVTADGRLGVFHPDNLTFGQTVYLSPLYAAAQAIAGVASVDVTTFQRRDQPGPAALLSGRITLGRLEIAQLANDPDYPERGVLTLQMAGGA